MIRRAAGHLARQRGQVIILFVGIFTFIAIAGAITVDFGLWFSERRGAQKDADLAALAGAQELLTLSLPSAGDAAEAASAAAQWLALNNQSGNATLEGPVAVDNTCFAGDPRDDPNRLDSVTVTVDHESRSLFAGIFDIVAPEIGARAKACVGAVTGLGGGVPIEIDLDGPCVDNGTPIYGQLCPLEFGSHDDNPRGILDLDVQRPDEQPNCSQAGGSGDLVDVIEWGSQGVCREHPAGVNASCNPAQGGPWDSCVATQTGNPRKVLEGFERRLRREGSCDNDGDGIDDFDEAVEGPIAGAGDDALYAARTCPNGQPSPRIIVIFVLPEDPPKQGPHNRGFPVVRFAAMYIVGCKASDDPIDGDITEGDFTVNERKCNVGGPGNPPGHVVVFGKFVNLLAVGTEIGPVTDDTQLLGISLVE